MVAMWTLSGGDYPLGKGSYDSAVKLYNLVQKLIHENIFFITEKPDSSSPKENPDQHYELTDSAMIAYSLLCNQFYMINMDKGDKISSETFNQVQGCLEIIFTLFDQKE